MPLSDSSPPDEPALSRQLGEFVADLDFAAIPGPVVEHAQLCLSDTLGCGLFGSTLQWSVILRRTLGRVDTMQGSPVWGTPERLGPLNAALANGAAVHAFELDDLHKESILHAGSVVTPAVFAAADIVSGVSGERLFQALIAGYEIGARTGMTIGTPHLLQGWHPTGTHGTLAAAAGAASVLGLDPVQTQHALGIAGSQSSGLMAAQFSSMVKRYHAGHAAQAGLYAALLAADGYTGIENLFESEYGGYCSTFSPTWDTSGLVEGLGERWEAARVGFKPYSANGSCHPAIDILKQLRAETGLRPADVEHVRATVSSATLAHVGWPYSPNSVTTAQMNLPYIAAVVISDGDAFVDQFTEERMYNSDLIELSRRVEVVADPEIDARGPGARHATDIIVRLRDGRTLHGYKASALGSPAEPLTPVDVDRKFRRLAAKSLGDGAVDQLARRIGEMAGSAAIQQVLAAAVYCG